jgi:predicted ATPase/class 3 adenylate cyclase/DNA-binding CsgD family transcriptional regulator
MADNHPPNVVLVRPVAWEDPSVCKERFMLPSGTVTLLLGDVAGSTAAWEADAGQARNAMADLSDLVAEMVGRFDGVRPLEQGEGDSFVAAFARARDGLGCALALQGRLAGGSVRVRLGMHSGDVIRTEMGTYMGPVIIRTARLRDLAHGGQTVVSEAARELVLDSLPDGVSLVDLGVHRLKDMSRPERVFQLCHPDLGAEFPPLRSLDSCPHNLPTQRTTFIGRMKEIAEVTGLLERNRLVTLTGSGGCGKTRLGLQVGAEVLEQFADGVWFVDLAAVAEAESVPAKVAATLGVLPGPSMIPADAVIAHLCPARALLITDNCEHVCADAAALVDMIMASCPGVSVLATSRQALEVEGEVTWRVPPMSLPAEIGAIGIEGLNGSEAVQLFAERASRARPGFCLDDRNQEAVGRICRSLDGIPLAIELAAARVRVLTPAQIAEGLRERFRLLTGSVRTAMPRQQTLEASLDWSYSLLTELERVVFRRLGVFAGSFDLESATAVCAGSEIDSWHVLDLITLLVDKSLVSVDDSDEVARYRLLETMRLYALNCIRAADEETPARNRHKTQYLRLVEAESPLLQGADSRLRLARLDADYANLQGALTWSQETGDADVLCRLVAGLVPFWIYGSGGLRIQVGEAIRWADAALTQSTPVPLPLRATLLWGKATFAIWGSDLPTAAGVAEEGLAIARQIGDDRLIGRCLINLALAQAGGDEAIGAGYLEEAITVSRRASDTFALGQALLGSIGVDFWRRPQLARTRAEEALAMTHEIDEQARGVMLSGYGYLLAVTGRPREGIQILESAREYAYQIGFVPAIMSAETLGALVYAACGNHEAALAAAQRVEEMGARLGMRRDTHASQTKALVAAARGELDQALRHSDVALQSAPGSLWQTNAIPVAAQVALAAGDLTAARAHVDKLADLSARNGYVITTAEADLLDSRIQRRQGDRHSAEHAAHRALSQSEQLPAWTISVDALEVLAGLAADAESYEEAARLLGSARQLRDTTGYQLCITERDADLAHVRDNLGPEHFDTLYAEGRDLSLNQAVSYARRGRGERKRPTTGWESLTPTETQITALLVDGLTNAEIGRRMFVSPRTVQTHLTRMYTKLGVTGRTELAARAAQRHANGSTGPGPQQWHADTRTPNVHADDEPSSAT